MPNRILLCDDEIHILRAAEFKLKRAGFDVQTASDGEEAWAAICERIPDIVVSDCQMPRLDGLGLAQRIRETPATQHLPMIVLSAKGFELSFEELSTRFNVRAVMAKPFSPRELLETVNAVLCEETDDRPLSPPLAETSSPVDLPPLVPNP